ncbi:hypothetical protein ACYOEI_34600, partial [Singulisphaera rosea]
MRRTSTCLILPILLSLIPAVPAAELEAGAAASGLVADDTLVIGGGIGPNKVKGQEGELRASAIVIR